MHAWLRCVGVLWAKPQCYNLDISGISCRVTALSLSLMRASALLRCVPSARCNRSAHPQLGELASPMASVLPSTG